MEEIKKLENEIATKKNDYIKEIRDKYPILWGIAASKDPNSLGHIVSQCIFTTKQNAQARCSRPTTAYRNTWYYKVVPIESSNVCADDLLHLDERRNYNYPYRDD